MSARRRIIAGLVTALVLGSIGMSATAAQAKTCQTAAGRYDVTRPAGPSAGADPAEVRAANCTLGFREQTAYPLSVIALCLLATAGTLLLVRRNASDDTVGSQA
jgi:hypothetical protein